MSASTPISTNVKLFRAKKKLLKSFILGDPYLDSSLGIISEVRCSEMMLFLYL